MKQELLVEYMEKEARTFLVLEKNLVLWIGLCSEREVTKTGGEWLRVLQEPQNKPDQVSARYIVWSQWSSVDTILYHYNKPSNGSTAHRQLRENPRCRHPLFVN